MTAMKASHPSPIARRLLKLAREHGHEKQLKAAKFLGLTQGRLSRLKTGSLQSVGVSTVARIARRTGCDLAWLITGKRSHPTPECILRLNKIMGFISRAA